MSNDDFVLERFASLVEAAVTRPVKGAINPELVKEAHELVGFVRNNGGMKKRGVSFLLAAPSYDAVEEWAKTFLRDRDFLVERWQSPETPTALANRLDVPVSRVYRALGRPERPIVRENRGPNKRLITIQSNSLFDSFIKTCELPGRRKNPKSTLSKKSDPAKPPAKEPVKREPAGPGLFDEIDPESRNGDSPEAPTS